MVFICVPISLIKKTTQIYEKEKNFNSSKEE